MQVPASRQNPPRGPDTVEWPDPSPLTSWWEQVMFPNEESEVPADGES
ncbi:hypothetical protein BJY24_004950 [Nocardia transvalensis]|uniref:Uncharacterized protein n=1 Tax=Nocardia transvalensis TaxID=37333 RepID=A0A7W9UK05_9NOCA|nr:hypothetical protein [Nocardia transvalensis]